MKFNYNKKTLNKQTIISYERNNEIFNGPSGRPGQRLGIILKNLFILFELTKYIIEFTQ